MKFQLLLLLFVLPSFISWAEPLYPLLNKPQVDSLKRQIWQTPPSTARVNLLLRLSDNLIATTQATGTSPDSAYAYAQQAQTLSEALHFTVGQLTSRYTIGFFLCITGKSAGQKVIQEALDRSRQQHNVSLEALGWYYLGITTDRPPAIRPARLTYFEQSARCYGLVHDLVRQAYCLKEVADIHLTQGKYLLARQELLRAEALYRASGFRKLQYTFDLLGVTNAALGNYKDALRYELAAIQSIKATQDTAALAFAYDRVAITYQELKQHEKALAYLRLASEQAEKGHHYYIVRDIAGTIAQNLIAAGRPKEAVAYLLQVQRGFPPLAVVDSVVLGSSLLGAYLATGQYKPAAKYCQQLSRQVKALPDNYRYKLRPYAVITRFYVATQQYDKARSYAIKGVAFSKQQRVIKVPLESSYLLLFKVDSAQGRLLAAIADFQQYKAVHDSIFGEQNSKEVAGLQIQYDTRAKEQSIALLTKQTLVQRMTIRHHGFQRNVFLGGTLLLVGLLGLGYNRYRLKQRSSRLLEQKQQALEAQQAEINRKNEALEQVLGEKDQLLEERQELLVEKDWMLKEIHHRVKNNLQVVSSLLSTQSRHLHDPQAVAAIRESQNRVQVMALLHQKLYQADSIGRVNIADYGREIVTYLVQSFDRQQSVQTKLELAPIELETTLATPLGLIINEAVTNALKHAFPPPRRGTLTVGLVSLAPQQYQLTIADDGVGLPLGFDLTRSRSLGMVIIKGLSRQIDGQLAVSTADGVCISLQFDTRKKPVYAEAVA